VRIRRRRFRTTASAAAPGSSYPIVIGFGPAISFEAGIDEAWYFAVELFEAIEQARRGGDQC
jgi:hypothetical protein